MTRVAATVFAALLALLLWWTWDKAVSVGWVVLTVAAMLASYFAPAVLGKWSWSIELVDPVAAVRSRVGKWGAVLMTWTIARWLVPRLTRRYLDAGRIETLSDSNSVQPAAGGWR